MSDEVLDKQIAAQVSALAVANGEVNRLAKALAEATRLLERANVALNGQVSVSKIYSLLADIQDWLRIARVKS